MKYFTLLGSVLKDMSTGYKKPFKEVKGVATNVNPSVEFSVQEVRRDPNILVSLEHNLEEMKSGYLAQVSSLLTDGNGEAGVSYDNIEGDRFEQLKKTHENFSKLGIPYSFSGKIMVEVPASGEILRIDRIHFTVETENENSVFYIDDTYDDIFEGVTRKEKVKKRFRGTSTKDVILKPNPNAVNKVKKLRRQLDIITSLENMFGESGTELDSNLLLDVLKKEKITIEKFKSQLTGKKVPDLPELIGIKYNGNFDGVEVRYMKASGETDFKLTAQTSAFNTPNLIGFCSKFENVFINYCQDKRLQ